LKLFAALYVFLNGLWFASLTEAFSQSGLANDGRVEEIYIARSVLESEVKPTDFCAGQKIGFGKDVADRHYTFRSVSTRVTDGRIVDVNAGIVGRLHGCIGSTADPAALNFYAEGVLANVPFSGTGECRTAKRDYPEPGIGIYRCFLELRGLPKGYAGGQLTTNTLVSRNPIGDKSDPPGYTQSSIATIRLWKRR